MDDLPPLSSGEELASNLPQNALLDFFFPGFSVFSTAIQKYLHIDLNLYIPLVVLFGGAIFVWRYFSEYFSDLTESYFMSVVDIRVDDEIYNMLMAWVANQRFAQGARRFVVNTNLNSRSWFLWRWDEDDDDDAEGGQSDSDKESSQNKTKALAYTPTFGSHWFLYKGRLLVFRRTQNKNSSSYMTASEREEISIACFGRNPWVLKELLHEARQEYLKRDEAKTLIYRGATKSGNMTEPVWQRCMARTSRPFSTVIINEKIKKDLIDDVTDYLNPATRRWYSNRGIPYRRGYLLHGPPGTGKSSLSLALAGFFKIRIYIVSLSSASATEENLATLFAELPRRCVVLLEDIDTAGLTHTREEGSQANGRNDNPDYDDDGAGATRSSNNPRLPGNGLNNPPVGRLSLSGLLNILDGVASQEGRVLIMTTNHIEKLDKALIRPGRVDMIVKFDRADTEMTAAIFRAIYAPLEGDDAPTTTSTTSPTGASSSSSGSSRALFQLERTLKTAASKLSPAEEAKREADAADAAREKLDTIAKVDALAKEFASKIPPHEFSPAEIQGFLLKNKRSPEKAVEGAEQWVADTRKEKKEKELKEAEEKREAEEKARKEKEKEEKKKEERKKNKRDEEEESSEEGASREKKPRKGKKKGKESKRKASSTSAKKSRSRRRKEESESEESDSAGSASSSGADSESELERETVAASKKRSKPAAEGKEKPALAATAEAKLVELVVVPAPPAITVDTVKAKEAALEVQKTPQGADSGYGTP